MGPLACWFSHDGREIPRRSRTMFIGCERSKIHSVMPQLKINVDIRWQMMWRWPRITSSRWPRCFEKAGFTNIRLKTTIDPGIGYHEDGCIRMGKDPKTSLLKWPITQLHAVPNVYVTDGAAMNFFHLYPRNPVTYLYGFCSESGASCGEGKARMKFRS